MYHKFISSLYILHFFKRPLMFTDCCSWWLGRWKL